MGAHCNFPADSRPVCCFNLIDQRDRFMKERNEYLTAFQKFDMDLKKWADQMRGDMPINAADLWAWIIAVDDIVAEATGRPVTG